MKLYSYQKELVNSKEDKVLINWARGSGKNVGVIAYILENKPSNVLFVGVPQHLKLTEDHYKSMFNYTVQEDGLRKVKIETNSGDSINVHALLSHPDRFNYQDYELIVDCNNLANLSDALKNYQGKYISVQTINQKCVWKPVEFHKVITVDYRKALKENSIDPIKVVEASRRETGFFNQYALLEDNKFVSFNNFREKALQKLQNQFLNTPDATNTVLTRKNIIEMIKDLKQI